MALFKTDIDLVREAADACRVSGMDDLPTKLDDLANRMQESYNKSVEALVAEARAHRER